MNMNNLELEYMRNLHNLEKRKTPNFNFLLFLPISRNSRPFIPFPLSNEHVFHPCPYESLVVSHERDLLRDPLKSLFSIIN